MIPLLVFAASYAGFATVALTMERYQRDVWRRRPSSSARNVLRVIGAFGVLLSLRACVARLDWSVGLVSWAGTATLTSLLLALLLAYRARHVLASAVLAWLVAGASAMF